jgi:hypothetical protein
LKSRVVVFGKALREKTKIAEQWSYISKINQREIISRNGWSVIDVAETPEEVTLHSPARWSR